MRNKVYILSLFVVLLALLIPDVSFAQDVPIDSLTFENKVVDLINKIEQGIVEVAPVAYEVALNTVWMESLIQIVSKFVLVLFFLGIGLPLAIWGCNKGASYKKRYSYDDGAIQFWATAFVGIVFIMISALTMYFLLNMTTEWVTVFDPRAGLVLKILNGLG